MNCRADAAKDVLIELEGGAPANEEARAATAASKVAATGTAAYATSRRSSPALTAIRSRCSACRRPASGLVARCFIPHAETVTAYTLAGKEAGELTRRDDAGFFEGKLSIRKRQPLRYHARNAGGEWWLTDPYSFGPVLGPMDDYYIAEGSHLRLFDKLGAHLHRP